MNCPNCNMPLEENMHFCGHCGMPIYQERTRAAHRPPVQNAYADPPPRKGGHGLQWCLIAGLLALCVCAGLFSWKLIADRRKQNGPAEQKCYYGTIKGKMRWDEAKERARDNDYYLARINSREEFDNLANALNEGNCQDRSFVLGARRPAGSQDFYWDGDESGVPLNSPDAWCADVWKDGVPNDPERDEDGYILMYYDEEAGEWRWRVVYDDEPGDEYMFQSDKEIDDPGSYAPVDPKDPVFEPLVIVEPVADPTDNIVPPPPGPISIPDPEPDPEQEPTDVLSGLSAEKRKSLNLFMSNFSETSLPEFDRGGQNDGAGLAHFAFMHCKINGTWADRLGVETVSGMQYETISGKNVDEVLDRYLNVKINHKTYELYNQTVKYENGKYYHVRAMGEIYATFSVVTEMIRDGDRYRVKFDVYDLDYAICGREGGIGDRYYAMTGPEAKTCGDLTSLGSGSAVLEDYTYNGYPTYRLISYRGQNSEQPEEEPEEKPEPQDDYSSELRAIQADGMDGHAFKYDANADGTDELFILYTEKDAPMNLWGEICTMQDGKLVRIHGPEKLCVLAGSAGGVIGAVYIDGRQYLEVRSYVYSTEAADGQDTERWRLYDVSANGFPKAREVLWSRSFGRRDDETTVTYDITDDGKPMTKAQYEAFTAPMIGVHLMAGNGAEVHWADDNGGDDNHPVRMLTLDEMCDQLEREAVSAFRQEPFSGEAQAAPEEPAGEEPDAAEFDEDDYTIVSSNKTWADAQAYARKAGGRLVTFDSEEEYRFVLELIERSGCDDVTFLLGGRRDPDGDTYYWVDENDEFYGGPLHGSGTWYDGCWVDGDPNYEYNGREESVVMMDYEKNLGRWAWFDGSPDYRNSNRSHGFIIEFDD